jgi:hypothetical protein
MVYDIVGWFNSGDNTLSSYKEERVKSSRSKQSLYQHAQPPDSLFHSPSFPESVTLPPPGMLGSARFSARLFLEASVSGLVFAGRMIK